MKKTTLTLLSLFTSFLCLAQMETDLYLFRISGKGDSLRLEFEKNLTHRAGYDNQPCFSEDGSLLYYSAKYKKTHDIYALDFNNGKPRNISRSPYTSEFSPMPHADGKSLTAVFIEEDSVTQRMWTVDMKNARARVMNKKIDSIGYYWPLGKNHYAAFVLGTNEHNHSLRLLDFNTSAETYITDSVGRCIRLVPGTEIISFVRKPVDKRWQLCMLNPSTLKFENVLDMPEGCEDYAWYKDFLFITKDSSVYVYKKNHAQPRELNLWRRFDLSDSPVRNAKRIALSPDFTKMVIAADDEK